METLTCTELIGPPAPPAGFVRAHGGSDIRDVNLNSEHWAVVKAALLAGMYPHIVRTNQGAAPLANQGAKKMSFHPTSVLSRSEDQEVQEPLWLASLRTGSGRG